MRFSEIAEQGRKLKILIPFRIQIQFHPALHPGVERETAQQPLLVKAAQEEAYFLYSHVQTLPCDNMDTLYVEEAKARYI